MENGKELLGIDTLTKTAEQLKQLELKAKQQQEAKAAEERQRKEDRLKSDAAVYERDRPVRESFMRADEEYKDLQKRVEEIGLQPAIDESNQQLAEKRKKAAEEVKK